MNVMMLHTTVQYMLLVQIMSGHIHVSVKNGLVEMGLVTHLQDVILEI